jgi:membrane-bound inhibitor of C-type lysozyme
MNGLNRVFCLCVVLAMCTPFIGCEEEQPGAEYKYVCSAGKRIYVSVSEDGERATVRYLGDTFKLKAVPSDSGVKFSDGKVDFWSKGTEAFLQIGGETVCDGCSLVE